MAWEEHYCNDDFLDPDIWDDGEMKWTMKNGERIAIEDMGTDHLRNTIRMIRRRCLGEDGELYIDAMTKELKQRGEMI